MWRHFARVYVLVVLAVAGVSWSQERLWLAFSPTDADDLPLSTTLTAIEKLLRTQPKDTWAATAAELSNEPLAVELWPVSDIAGKQTLQRLAAGTRAHLQADNESWLMRQLDADSVLAVRYVEPPMARGRLEWSLALLFYAAIALVVMIWLWPLTRDLRRLEKATGSFGNRNWEFRADIHPRSQVFALAETFRKMAARIDGLIGSHKDLSNAVAHEIKTPLARMQFEIEAARHADPAAAQSHLEHIKSDIAHLNALVSATLDYAVLERADMALNSGTHDFTKIVPAIVAAARRDAPRMQIDCDVDARATHVRCDAHLITTALNNLLNNAVRHARSRVRIQVRVDDDVVAAVHDDGPGIGEQDRQRVFQSFVQLEPRSEQRKGFGLGLAIVKRIAEWHDGSVSVTASPLGGAAFELRWPVARATARDP